MHIEIENPQIATRTNDSGKQFHEQNALMWTAGSKWPTQIKLRHDNADHPYPVGEYEISDSSFRVNQWGSLELNPFGTTLIPREESKKKVS